MKKESLADKLARKSFESAQFQKSWMVHIQAFGPILEPAFPENYQAKVHLCAALNQISNRNLSQGLAKLKQLQKYLETDADKCAYLFFMGLFCEMSGQTGQMMQMYTYANEYGHRFYLPYAKVAKLHQQACDYDLAEKNYRAAAECFTATGLGAQEKIILGSLYANLATTLTMMHRYEEADAALVTCRSLCPDAPGAAMPEAFLGAIRGDEEKVKACMMALEHHAPEAARDLKKKLEDILDRSSPLFFPQPLDAEKMTGFWAWFERYAPAMEEKLDSQEYETALTPLAGKLLETFPFLEEEALLSLGRNEKGYVICLKDLYAVALTDAYEKLLEICPEPIKDTWQFDLIH